MSSKDLIQRINNAILKLEGEKVGSLVREALGGGMDVVTLINDGLTAGLQQLGSRFERGEVFLPELMMGAKIVQSNMRELESNIKKEAIKRKEKILIGTVAGDIHDVGKNIVCTVFSAAGYEVIDLGINVPTEKFVECVRAEKPDLLGLSALLTTTMINQRKVIEALEAEGLRKEVKVIIGGAPVSGSWAKKINADAFAEDAFSGLKRAEELLERQ
jgi:5-methyltetrahydrofolate--homocysteine methyltransferase